MKRLMALLLLLVFTLTPLVKGCMMPADNYAVEVVLNKPGIVYRPYPSFYALHNALVKDGTFIFRSHYDKRLYVLLWNESDGPHLKVGIPVEWKSETVSVASLNLSILLTEDALESLKKDGWSVEDNTTFERNGVVITLVPVNGGECTFDSDCATGGCSGEVCAPKEKASNLVTPCVYKPWYGCLELTTCGCVNGVCTWKPNQAFERCLREHGVDPSKVIRSGYFELTVKGTNKSDGEINAAVKDFLGAFGVSCSAPLTLVKSSVTRLSLQVDPSEVNASRAVGAELEWLRSAGVLEIDDADVEAIAKAAEWGFAGHNGKIGWYEAKNGSYAWMPYYKSKNPLLIRCSSREVPSYELPNGTAYVGPTPTQPGQEQSAPTSPQRICGPGIMILLPLALLGRR